jgi:predicted PurR-regulated permease PerM
MDVSKILEPDVFYLLFELFAALLLLLFIALLLARVAGIITETLRKLLLSRCRESGYACAALCCIFAAGVTFC